MNILIIGGIGFIGKVFVKSFLGEYRLIVVIWDIIKVKEIFDSLS